MNLDQLLVLYERAQGCPSDELIRIDIILRLEGRITRTRRELSVEHQAPAIVEAAEANWQGDFLYVIPYIPTIHSVIVTEVLAQSLDHGVQPTHLIVDRRTWGGVDPFLTDKPLYLPPQPILKGFYLDIPVLWAQNAPDERVLVRCVGPEGQVYWGAAIGG